MGARHRWGGVVAQVEGYMWMRQRWLAAAGGGWQRRGKAVTAAAAAGVLSLDELVELVTARGRGGPTT